MANVPEMAEIKKLVNKVQDFAEKNKFAYLIPEQMLYVLLDDEKCAKLIKNLTTDKNNKKTIPELKNEVFDYIDKSVEKNKDISEINPTNAYTKLIQSSISQGALRSMEPDSLCVFMMLFNDKSQASAYFLSKHGIMEDNVHKYIMEYRNKEHGEKSFLNKFATNITELAADGKIDPLVGREKEIERIIQVLAKKRSSCPILVGESGTGKSAVVEGLALKISNNQVPKSLMNKTIWTLNLTSMVAGTRFRGEFEERLENTINEVAGDDDIILFIDEIHTIVGAGSTEGSLDSANILKPYLSKGSLHIIGATTYDEYKNKIEKDKALCRRFKKIDLLEPSKEETFKILQGLREKYEEFHKIHFSDEVLQKAVDLSERFIVGKFFPDKAIDVMDEIGAKYHSGLKDGKEATVEDVEDVICAMANIPKITVETNEKTKLKDLDERIKKNLFGQDETVDKIVKQIKMSKAGLYNIGKPISNLMLGPTGCVTGDTKIKIRKVSDNGITKITKHLD